MEIVLGLSTGTSPSGSIVNTDVKKSARTLAFSLSLSVFLDLGFAGSVHRSPILGLTLLLELIYCNMIFRLSLTCDKFFSYSKIKIK